MEQYSKGTHLPPPSKNLKYKQCGVCLGANNICTVGHQKPVLWIRSELLEYRSMQGSSPMRARGYHLEGSGGWPKSSDSFDCWKKNTLPDTLRAGCSLVEMNIE